MLQQMGSATVRVAVQQQEEAKRKEEMERKRRGLWDL